MQPLLIVLHGEKPYSWNRFYAGTHFHERKRMAHAVHALVAGFLPVNAEVYTVPVDITITAYFKSRPLDADNIVGKLYIDGLKGKILQDDNPRWVRSVKTVSLMDKALPRVEIEIVPVEGL